MPTTGAFLGFSLVVYGRPGVSSLCIALQDDYQLDVNMVLFCLFAASRGQALADPDFIRLEACVSDWRQQVIHPLRAVRRWLKTPAGSAVDTTETLRGGLLAHEIEAESLQQHLMERALPIANGMEDPTLAAANVERYLNSQGLRCEGALASSVAALLQSADVGVVRPPEAR